MSVSAISSNSGYLEELFSVSSSRRASPAQEMAEKLFNDLDSDQDLAVSLEESGLDESVFNLLDSDGSGTVSVAELEAALENSAMFARMQFAPQGPPAEEGADMPNAQDMLAEILNGEGAEQVAAVSGGGASGGGGAGGSSDSEEEDEYDSLDTNQDGVVSAGELQAAMRNGTISTSGGLQAMLMGLFSALAGSSYSTAAASYSAEQALDLTA